MSVIGAVPGDARGDEAIAHGIAEIFGTHAGRGGDHRGELRRRLRDAHGVAADLLTGIGQGEPGGDLGPDIGLGAGVFGRGGP